MVTTAAAKSGVIRVDESHSETLAEFYRAVWDRKATATSVLAARRAAALANLAHPGAEIPTYLFVQNDRAVGHITTIPMRLWTGVDEIPAHWLKGLMVLPETRNGPVGFLVLKHAVAALEATMALVVEDAAIRLYRALGFADLGVMPNYLLPLRADALLRRIDPANVGLRGLSTASLRLLRVARAAPIAAVAGMTARVAQLAWTIPSRGVHSAVTADVPEDADALWGAVRTELGVAPARNRSALQARYGAQPERYEFIASRAHGTLTGIGVLRRPSASSDPRLGGARVAVLSDMVAAPGRADVMLGLLRAAEARARAQGAHALLCTASHAALRYVLRRRGFVRLPGNVHVLAHRVGNAAPLSDYWLFRGDSDADEVF